MPILWINRPFSEDNSGYKLCIVLGLESLTSAFQWRLLDAEVGARLYLHLGALVHLISKFLDATEFSRLHEVTA